MLYTLAQCKGHVLDSRTTLDALQVSHAAAEKAMTKVRIAEEAQENVVATLEQFRPLATRAAILFATGIEMVHVEHAYRFSFDWFVSTFGAAVRAAAAAVPGGLTTISSATSTVSLGAGGKEAQERRVALLLSLMEDVTSAVHGHMCRSFFSEHRILFTTMFTLQLQLRNGNAPFSAAEAHFLLYGTVPQHAIPAPTR